ncbi:MAG: DUF4982 domain-containing protein, partial [Novosphingobium sp.]
YFAGWPWVNAWCGDIDLIGRQKPASLARDVAWGLSSLEMAVRRPTPDGHFPWVANWGWPDELESWTWSGQEGKPLSVRLYTSADRVELLLNGRKLGDQAPDKMKAEFAVPYAPGKIEAVAYKDGRVVGRRKLETVGAAARLRLTPERPSTRSGREALAFVPIEVLDGQGRVLPEDQRSVTMKVTGPAELAAFGSANPLAVGSLQAPEAQTFRGRALAILRAKGSGRVRIEARSPGLPGAAATINFG